MFGSLPESANSIEIICYVPRTIATRILLNSMKEQDGELLLLVARMGSTSTVRS